MSRRCCVSYCNAKYSKTCSKSIFAFPRNEVKRDLWLKAIPGPLQNKNFICIDHFHEDHIKRFDEFGGVKTVYKVPQLRPDAVPSIFNNTSSTVVSASPNKKARAPRLVQIIIRKEPQFEPHDLINSIDEMRTKIVDKIDFGPYNCQINEYDIYIYHLNLFEGNLLKISTSIYISNNLELTVFDNEVKQTDKDLEGIVNPELKLEAYSQLQKLLNKYITYEITEYVSIQQ